MSLVAPREVHSIRGNTDNALFQFPSSLWILHLQFEDEDDFLLIFIDLVQLYNIFMVDVCQDLYFPLDIL